MRADGAHPDQVHPHRRGGREQVERLLVAPRERDKERYVAPERVRELQNIV